MPKLCIKTSRIFSSNDRSLHFSRLRVTPPCPRPRQRPSPQPLRPLTRLILPRSLSPLSSLQSITKTSARQSPTPI